MKHLRWLKSSLTRFSMDDLFADFDFDLDPQLMQKRGSAEQSTAALIASSMNSDYTYDWSQRQQQAPSHMVQAPHHMIQPPNHMVHPPNHMVQPPNHMVQPTHHIVHSPNHMIHAPNHLVHPPSHVVPTPNHMIPMPPLTQHGPASYDPVSSSCSADVNGIGTYGLPAELNLPPMTAPTDNLNYIPQFSDLMNYPNLEPFGEPDQSKSIDVGTLGNNGSVTYGDNGVLGPAACHELQRIDGKPESTFMEMSAPAKKDYPEEAPYYTDLDIFKPSEEGPKNSDGSFLSPSIEVSNQFSPNDQLSAGDTMGTQKKNVKSPRKTPTKKRKGANNENPPVSLLSGLQSDSSDHSDFIGFDDVPNYGDGSYSYPTPHSDSNSVAFPQIPLEPPLESTSLSKGKVKTPRKTPSKKKKPPVANYSATVDASSLKIKLKCEKSIGTDNAEWSVSGDAKGPEKTPPPTQTANSTSVQRQCDNLDLIEPANSPKPTGKADGNKTEPVPSRGSENQTKAEKTSVPPVLTKSSSIIQYPTAKAPSYLTGFPMRCPDYPIVYCCNYCARIFTSIRGGQLHECIKKRPGRKAGVKLQ